MEGSNQEKHGTLKFNKKEYKAKLSKGKEFAKHKVYKTSKMNPEVSKNYKKIVMLTSFHQVFLYYHFNNVLKENTFLLKKSLSQNLSKIYQKEI